MVYQIAEAKRRFSELVKRAAYAGEVVELGTRGKAEVALVSRQELRRLQELDREIDARRLERAIRSSRELVPFAPRARVRSRRDR